MPASKMLSFLLPALMFPLALAQLQSSMQKLSTTCDMTVYEGVSYKRDNLYGEGEGFQDDDLTLEQCGMECLAEKGCVAINFDTGLKKCFVHSSGLPDANADETLYDKDANSIHAIITCNRKPSGPVGCGTQAAAYKPTLHKKTRIIGGSEASPHSWPWVVAMFVTLKNGSETLCGSSLLRVKDGVDSSDIVLTAAHCVTEDETMATIPVASDLDKIEVTAGEHDIMKYDDGQETRAAAQIRFHPEFKFTKAVGGVNDVALVKLAQPISFTDTIRPICLPASGEDIPVGKTCVAAGWGRVKSKTSEIANTLQQLLSPARDAETCQKGWGSRYKESIMICAGSLTGTSGTCQGDSGGMLACQQSDNSWTLYGATSFGVANTCLAPGHPPVFTRVSSFVDWITENMREMSSIE